MLKLYDYADPLGIDEQQWNEWLKTPQSVVSVDEGHSFGMLDQEMPDMPWHVSYEAIDRIIEPQEVNQ